MDGSVFSAVWRQEAGAGAGADRQHHLQVPGDPLQGAIYTVLRCWCTIIKY